MPNLGVFFLCYIYVLLCAIQAFHHQDQPSTEYFINDYVLNERIRRGMPSTLRSLLKTTTLIYQGKDYKVYGRRGGFRQALKDWYKLKPTNVADFGQYNKWGDIGDRTVMLDMENGRAILNILESKTMPDGDVVRIVNKIKYSDNYPKVPFPLSKN